MQTVARPLPRSTLTAAVTQVASKTRQAAAKQSARPLIKCFVAGSRWGRLVPRDELTSPAKLVERLHGGGAEGGPGPGPGEARTRSVLLIAGEARALEFKAGPGTGAARDARWAAAARKASRVYVRSEPAAS